MRVTANVILRDPKTGAVTVVNAGEEVPEWASGLVASHVLDQDDEQAVPAGYASQTVAALREEIDRRNEGREEADLIPAEGKKADLVAALEADDDN